MTEKPLREPWRVEGMIMQANGRLLIVKPQTRSIAIIVGSAVEIILSFDEAEVLRDQIANAIAAAPQPRPPEAEEQST